MDEGSSGVTLEKVAAEAGVSKGGLLYHFKSKSDLYDGLARRFRAQEEANIARARETGVVETFLRVSEVESAESAAGLWALLTAMRGNDELSETARDDVLFIFNGWCGAHPRADRGPGDRRDRAPGRRRPLPLRALRRPAPGPRGRRRDPPAPQGRGRRALIPKPEPTSVALVHEYRVLDSEIIHRGWCYDLTAETIAMPGGGTAPAASSSSTSARSSPSRSTSRAASASSASSASRQRSSCGSSRRACATSKDEDPAVAARRELAEEVDLHAAELVKLGEFYSTPGISSERIHYYLATGLSPVPEADRHERTDEETHIELVWWDLDKALAAVADGEIRNGVCALALSLAKLHLDRN